MLQSYDSDDDSDNIDYDDHDDRRVEEVENLTQLSTDSPQKAPWWWMSALHAPACAWLDMRGLGSLDLQFYVN